MTRSPPPIAPSLPAARPPSKPRFSAHRWSSFIASLRLRPSFSAEWCTRPFFSMVNLIAGGHVVPELIQDDFTPAAVAAEVRRLLESSAARDEMKAGLAEVRAKLGSGGAIERAADIFAQML